jgi:acyl-CoA reductase-like NAD-dependent aldehyde dehydrogenase
MEKPMHDLDKVDELFQGFGVVDLTVRAAHKAAKRKLGRGVAREKVENSAKLLRSKVVKMVARRHEIVHYGDYFQGKGALQEVTAEDVQKQIEHVRRLVAEADEIIESATTVRRRRRAPASTGPFTRRDDTGYACRRRISARRRGLPAR